MPLRSTNSNDATPTTCDRCGHPVDVVDRFRDYSTTRGPMAEHIVTRCATCGQQDLVHLAAVTVGPDR